MSEDFKFKRNIKSMGDGPGFWHMLTIGGDILPEELLEDKDQIKKVKDAIKVLCNFENDLYINEILEEQ